MFAARATTRKAVRASANLTSNPRTSRLNAYFWGCEELRRTTHGFRSATRPASAKHGSSRLERLIRYSARDETGCWIWQRRLNTRGYPRLGNGYAHRAAYEEFVGPIPDGRQIHHTCANKACVNPAHLEALTDAEHRARHFNPEVCRNGHPRNDENTYVDARGVAFCRVCHRDRMRARRSGVRSVSQVVTEQRRGS